MGQGFWWRVSRRQKLTGPLSLLTGGVEKEAGSVLYMAFLRKRENVEVKSFGGPS